MAQVQSCTTHCLLVTEYSHSAGDGQEELNTLTAQVTVRRTQLCCDSRDPDTG